MVGRSILDANRGVVPRVLDGFGIEKVSFFDQKLPAFLGIVAMESRIAVPFMMVMLLAGLQALPTEIFEAAQIDGSTGWRRFWDMTFPLMLPVSLTAIVLRVIFEFKLVDLVRIVTAGGPGGSTDTVSLYIYREGVESGNVGYATTMAMVFLFIVLISVTALLVIDAARARRCLLGGGSHERRSTIHPVSAPGPAPRAGPPGHLRRPRHLGVYLPVSAVLDDHDLREIARGRHSGPRSRFNGSISSRTTRAGFRCCTRRVHVVRS